MHFLVPKTPSMEMCMPLVVNMASLPLYFSPDRGDTLYSDLSDASAVLLLVQDMCHPYRALTRDFNLIYERAL